jgi:hypothetical protein
MSEQKTTPFKKKRPIEHTFDEDPIDFSNVKGNDEDGAIDLSVGFYAVALDTLEKMIRDEHRTSADVLDLKEKRDIIKQKLRASIKAAYP